MQTLADGVYTEDFVYGDPYSQRITVKPPQFDYVGTAVTNAGVLVCENSTFELHYGSNADNPDASQPYGGPTQINPGYLRFPTLSWGERAGLFLSVITSEPCMLSFDRSFSGYVGDRFIVTVNGAEKLAIGHSAGYSWTRSEIPLGRGVYKIAFVLLTAPFQPQAIIREGIAQSPQTADDLLRFLRIANLSITALAEIPVATNARMTFLQESTLTASPTMGVSLGKTTWTAESALLYPLKLLGFHEWITSSELTVEAEVGRAAELTFACESALTAVVNIDAHTAADSGGFSLSATAALHVESTAVQDITELIRPLRRVSLRMTRPVMASGHPQTMLAVCETEVGTTVTGGLALGKIDPYSPDNKVPGAVGGAPSYRWLSIDAHRDPNTLECTEWHAKDDFDAPYWSTPGAYRPQVDLFTLKLADRIEAVRYPSVQFDAAHLDHLNIELPSVSSEMTWAFVGSFTRFRGMLHDSAPIIDYAADAVVDYAPITEETAIRREFMAWTDEPTSLPSIYLGLCSYGANDPGSSRIAWRVNDEKKTYNRADRAVITDNTPVVLIYRVSGSSSTVSITPLNSNGAQGTVTVPIPRQMDIDTTLTKFSLGRSRFPVPFDGSFLTGSMSLLEVAWFPRALTTAQAAELSKFYASLYAPVTSGQITQDLTKGTADAGTEQALIYAGNPETQLTLITGDRAVPLGLFASTEEGVAEINRLLDQGVPTIMCSNNDYASILARLEAE
jgi:hypothetical protein